jgi:hypothetical protein
LCTVSWSVRGARTLLRDCVATSDACTPLGRGQTRRQHCLDRIVSLPLSPATHVDSLCDHGPARVDVRTLLPHSLRPRKLRDSSTVRALLVARRRIPTVARGTSCRIATRHAANNSGARLANAFQHGRNGTKALRTGHARAGLTHHGLKTGADPGAQKGFAPQEGFFTIAQPGSVDGQGGFV